MVLSQSNIPGADFLINRDPWLRRLGGRQAGRRISESLFECTPAILRGRPIYDRLPGAAEAYNKDSNTFISSGTIIIPEVRTVISTAEDAYFRSKFPELYQERDFITGSFLGAGSAAALFEDSMQPLRVGDVVEGRNIFLRSAVIFWANEAIRDASNIAKQSIRFGGSIFTLPNNSSGWFWIDGTGTLQVSESLPDGIANLTGNIWCDPRADATIGERVCVQRVISFDRPETFNDVLDVGLTDLEITWPPQEQCEEPLLNEVTPLFRYAINDGTLTVWEDYRRFNTSFEAPVARWLMDYFDNLLQEKREQIDTFVDDHLNPDSVGLQFVATTSQLRQNYRPETVDKILDAWDFGLIDPNNISPSFDFLSPTELEELIFYDRLTNLWLDWLAQHFGFQDNGTENQNYWHRGSFLRNELRENEVYYTISEKRTILRNALSQDRFQEYVNVGASTNINPIWSSFFDFWDQTEAIWNQELTIVDDQFEYQFTRFPFTMYNRIRPAEWYGLMRAKGTTKGLEFMFDTLGLHGYACTTDEPRFFDETADFDTPLIAFKFSNPVVVGRRKFLDDSGAIQESNEFHIQGYEATGILRAGETILSDGYDRKTVVRAPFSWSRDSQRWNRLVEISSTYAREGDVVRGYYHYITGQSAAGEPIWLPESCDTCRYLVTTRLLDASNLNANNLDEQHPFLLGGDPEFTWVQNLRRDESDGTWTGIGYNRFVDGYTRNHAVSPTYIDERTIIVGFNRSEYLDYDANADFPMFSSFPGAISRDNGCTFERLDPFVMDIFSISDIRNFSGNIYAIGSTDADNPETTDIVYRSRDIAETWKIFVEASDLEGFDILDIFHDVDGKRIYAITKDAVWARFELNKTWTKLLQYPLSTVSPNSLGGSGTLTPEYRRGKITKLIDETIVVFLYEANGGSLLSYESPNEGQNWFVGNIDTNVPSYQLTENAVDVKLRTIVNSLEIDENAISFMGLFYSTNDEWRIVSRGYDGTYVDFPFYDAIEPLIEENITEDSLFFGETISGVIVTDIAINYKNLTFELLTTALGTSSGGYGGHIVSSALNYSNLNYVIGDIITQNVDGNTDTIDTYTSYTQDFLVKVQTTADINAAPKQEPINFTEINPDYVNAAGTSQQSLHYQFIDNIDVCVPSFSDGDSHDLLSFANVPEAWKYTPIAAFRQLSGYSQVSWVIPTLRDGLFFRVWNPGLPGGTYLDNLNYENSLNPYGFEDDPQEIINVSCEEFTI